MNDKRPPMTKAEYDYLRSLFPAAKERAKEEAERQARIADSLGRYTNG